jgi:hypothetical protein
MWDARRLTILCASMPSTLMKQTPHVDTKSYSFLPELLYNLRSYFVTNGRQFVAMVTKFKGFYHTVLLLYTDRCIGGCVRECMGE